MMQKIIRKPIIDPKKMLIKKAKEYLEYYNTLGAATEEDILEVSFYYDYKSRQVCNTTGFRSLSLKDYIHHKNWKFFAKLYNLCDRNKWNYKLYIDAQFDRASYWKKTKRPYPSQLCAASSQEYFLKYLKGREEECKADGTKVKSGQAKDIYKEIQDCLIQDCILIKNGIKFMHSNSTQSDKKTSVLFDNILSLSGYYIASVDWLFEVLVEYNNTNASEAIHNLFEKAVSVKRSAKITEYITHTLSIIETSMKLPETLSREKLLSEG